MKYLDQDQVRTFLAVQEHEIVTSMSGATALKRTGFLYMCF